MKKHLRFKLFLCALLLQNLFTGHALKAQNTPISIEGDHPLTFLTPPPSSGFTPLGGGPGITTQTCGHFKLYFIDTLSTYYGFSDTTALGASYRNTFCEALNYIDSVITVNALVPPGGIEIDCFSDNNPTSNFVAFAGSYPDSGYRAGVPGFYAGYVHNHIISGKDPDLINHDGGIHMNFGLINQQSCTVDLKQVLIHEMTHILGFLSSVTADRIHKTTARLVSKSTGQAQAPYNLFDKFFLYSYDKTSSSYIKLIDPNTATSTATLDTFAIEKDSVWLYNAIDQTNLPIVSDAPYRNGTSLSHFNAQYSLGRCAQSPGFVPEFIMRPSVIFGHPMHKYAIQELKILQTLGYTLNPVYADNALANNRAPYVDGPMLASIATAGVYDDFGTGINPKLDLGSINSCQTLNLDLGARTELHDADGDAIRIYPNSLFNIRGCGLGNNHIMLNVQPGAGTNGADLITFTPRTNFAGRAQFGFYLYDGHQRGSFVVYTITVVKKSPCFGNGNELVINGSLEEGNEYTTTTHTTTEMNLLFAENFLPSAQSSNNIYAVNWALPHADGAILDFQSSCDLITEGSYKHCEYGEHYYTPENNNFPNQSGSNRYIALVGGEQASMFLSDTLKTCIKYKLKIDAAQAQNTTSPISFDIYAGKVPANNQFHVASFTVSNTQTWNHLSVSFVIPPPLQIYTYLNIRSAGAYLALDNISLQIDSAGISPVVAHAGPDQNSFGLANDTLGGKPTAGGGVPPYTYLWTPNTAFATANTIANPVVHPSVTVTYFLRVTDACGNVGRDTAIITGCAPANAGPDLNICRGQSVTLTAGSTGPSFQYRWRPATGLSDTTISNPAANPATTITYRVFVTNGAGCSGSDDVVINVDTVPFTLTKTDVAPCFGSSDGALHINIPGSNGPFHYAVSGSGTFSGTTPAAVDITGLSAGTYNVIITTASGCTHAKSIVIIQPPALATHTNGPVLFSCPNAIDTLRANATGGMPPYAYLWSTDPFGFNIGSYTLLHANPSPNPTIIIGQGNGQGSGANYVVTVTDANGCTAGGNVYAAATLDARVDNLVQTACYGTEMTIGGSPAVDADGNVSTTSFHLARGGVPPYTYQWGPNDGSIIAGINAPQATVIVSQNETYTVTVTDATGCTAIATAQILLNSPPHYDFVGREFPGVHKITLDTTWGGGNTIYVKGVIWLDYGTTLNITNGTRVEFVPDPGVPNDLGFPQSGIVVYPTATLNISGNPVLTGSSFCTQMWDGIQVWGPDSANRGVITLNGATIDNASAGIAMYRPNTPFSNGGVAESGCGLLTANNVTFTNNFVDIAFSGVTALQHNQSRIQNCVFQTPGGLIDGYKYGAGRGAFAHILLSNVYGVGIMGGNNFSGLKFSGQQDVPVFIGNGIVSYDAGYDVAGYLGTQANPKQNTFNTLNRGIDAYSTGGTGTKIRIRNNHFTKVKRGITTNSTHFDEIIADTFDSIPYKYGNNIDLDTTGHNSAYGMYTYYANGYVATDNTISTNTQLSAFTGGPFVYGMIARGAGVNNASQIYRNTVSSNFLVGSQMEQGNTFLQLGCNQYTGNNTYDWVVASGILGPQAGCIPGNVASPAGNTFGTTCGVPDKQIHLNNGVPGFVYNTQPALIPSCITTGVNVNGCGVAAGGIYIPALSCPDNKTTFYTPPPIASAPRPCLLCPITHSVQRLINQINNTIAGLQRSILSNQIISGLLDNNNVQGVLQILGASGKVSDIKIMIPTYLAQQNCDAARQLLAQVPATATTGASAADNIAYQQLFNMLTNVCSSGRVIAQLTPGEKNVIVTIAAGNTQVAVNAQALLAKINKAVYTRVPEGIKPLFGSGREDGNLLNEALPEANALTAVPNPFNATTTIKYQLKDYASGVMMLVFDITGRKVKEYHLDDKQMGEVSFEAGNNQSGLYICQLWNAGNLISVQKMILLQ